MLAYSMILYVDAVDERLVEVDSFCARTLYHPLMVGSSALTLRICTKNGQPYLSSTSRRTAQVPPAPRSGTVLCDLFEQYLNLVSAEQALLSQTSMSSLHNSTRATQLLELNGFL